MTPPTIRWREALLNHGSALALYLGLALLMTWPMPLQCTTAVPGNGFDTWQNMWNMWWLREALLTRSNPFFTPYLQSSRYGGGQERHEVALRIESGATPVQLHAPDAEVAVRALGIEE
jgi:hypothetical protein